MSEEEKPTRQLRLRLLFHHPTIDPNEISEALLAKPYLCAKVGELRRTPQEK